MGDSIEGEDDSQWTVDVILKLTQGGGIGFFVSFGIGDVRGGCAQKYRFGNRAQK